MSLKRFAAQHAKKMGLSHKSESYVKAQPTAVDGYNFPSKFHAAVYCELKLWLLSGEYENLRVEQRLHVCGNLYWKSDFVIFNKSRETDEAHEAKGFENMRFRTICQAWKGVGPMDLFIWKGDHRRPQIAKIIRGKPYAVQE